MTALTVEESTLLSHYVPKAVVAKFSPLEEPYFANYIVVETNARGKEEERIITRTQQMKTFNRLVAGDWEYGDVVTISDVTSGASARNFACHLILEFVKQRCRVKWCTLSSDWNTDLGITSYDMLDVLVLDGLYATSASLARIERARDLVLNKPQLTILICSEKHPYTFADQLGMPTDAVLFLNNLRTYEI